jgi:predicted transcriptional regulator
VNLNGDLGGLSDLVRVRELVRSGAARSARIASGLSLGELANAAGVAVSTISRYERGQRIPRGDPALRYGAVILSLMGRRP